MKYLPLSNGEFTMVDDDDYDWLRGFNWSASGKKTRRYATRGTRNRKLGTQTKFYLHRVLLNAPPDKHVDHINGDTFDNRKCNLRLCEHKENIRNAKRQKRNVSGFKGVSFSAEKERYVAHIRTDGKSRYLGYFDKKEDAARAYNLAAQQFFGKFARLNPL